MKFTPYWLDTAPQGPDRSRTNIGGHVDVAIVGAGLTGLSAALHLARKGANVHVFEKETVGWGASGRNGGMATTGLSIGFRDAVSRYGLDIAKAYLLAYHDAVDTVEKVISDEGIDCDFARTGKLNLASRPAHLDGMRKTAEMLSGLGFEHRVVGRNELRAEIGSDQFHGAMVDSRSAGLHVGKFTKGLAEAAVRAGATIHEKAPVEQFRRLGGTKHELVTARGTVRADQVLVATSGYTGRPFRWQQVRIAPVGSFIIVTEPLGEDACDELLPTRRMASTSKNLLNYFRITPDHRLLFGGRARFTMSNPQSDEKCGRILQRGMTEFFPHLANARVDYCWGGLVDMSMDRMVHAGERDGLFYSLGYSGHGVQMATHMGKQMAEYLNGTVTANPWRDLKFNRIPGHFGPPWFLPFAGAFYKFKDLVK
ncbi:glycine/D-amino acid oxidase-like deaminating enzyme [Lentzea atacamensis]|uniref:Glycine/D-amino acid oxidase-like deaminating enzyme n=1 Tax=Lentzea atacamensis TaxID=531938 RepID=A0A316HJZ4_9PSEU|nr:FAD-binding oxidoreductase [Lentzea atacamensis]PWK80796.1 glycine/D-amino acid oxidase-like deaminating enzyme [Lentzea atacamensis]